MDNNLIAFSTDAENKGYKNLNYEGKPGSNSVTATWGDYNDSYAFDTSGLTNIDGKLYGTREQLDNIFAAPKTQVRGVANSQGVNVGYDRNNNPILNGQTISTNGMINNGGHWYGDQKQVQQIVNNAKPAEYVNPYDDQTNSLLKQLLNYKSFNYNPNQDKDLQTAMKFARVQAMQDAVERGQGNSTGMEWAASQAANNLIPQYRQQALDIYNADRGYLKDLLGEARTLKTVAADEYKMLEDLYNQKEQLHNDAIRLDREGALTTAEINQINAYIRQGDKKLELDEYNIKENLKLEKEKIKQTADQFTQQLNFDKEKFDEDKVRFWVQQQFEVNEADKNRALQILLTTGMVQTQYMADLLGVDVGTTTLDWLQNKWNEEVEKGKLDLAWSEYGLDETKYKDSKTPPGGDDGSGDDLLKPTETTEPKTIDLSNNPFFKNFYPGDKENAPKINI